MSLRKKLKDKRCDQEEKWIERNYRKRKNERDEVLERERKVR